MLYIVSTPIGNMGDISYRAVETLKNADAILCEDTRHSYPLLKKYGIENKKLIAYHKFNEKSETDKIISLLEENGNVALITDAGTPLVSDPGSILVKELIKRGLPFTTVPGATAFVSALVLSGLLDYRFCFVGFLPEKKADVEKLLEKYVSIDCPLIFYAAPHDLKSVIKSLYGAFGDRKAVAVREITKFYEERVDFTLSKGYEGEERGEFVLIVDGAEQKTTEYKLSPTEEVAALVELGDDKMTAIKQVAKERGIKKSDLYAAVVKDNN